MEIEITLSDFEHCRETWEGLENDGEEYGEEVVMTSFGYVNVTEDGDVITVFGGVLFNVAEDEPEGVVGITTL